MGISKEEYQLGLDNLLRSFAGYESEEGLPPAPDGRHHLNINHTNYVAMLTAMRWALQNIDDFEVPPASNNGLWCLRGLRSDNDFEIRWLPVALGAGDAQVVGNLVGTPANDDALVCASNCGGQLSIPDLIDPAFDLDNFKRRNGFIRLRCDRCRTWYIRETDGL